MLCLVALMMISGCSQSSAAEGTTKTQTIEVDTKSEVFNKALANEEGIDLTNRDYGQGLVAANGNPSFEDFDWFEDLIYGGFPEGRYYPKLKYIEGIWKYRIRLIRDSSTDGYMYDEIGIGDLTLDYENVELIINLHPQMARDAFEVWPIEEGEINYEEFRGGFNQNGGLTLLGNNLQVDIEHYYEYEGNEYITGAIYKDGDFLCDIMFLRD